MDAVEGAREDKVVIVAELLQARRKVAIIDQPTSLVDDEEGEDDPVSTLVNRVADDFKLPRKLVSYMVRRSLLCVCRSDHVL